MSEDNRKDNRRQKFQNKFFKKEFSEEQRFLSKSKHQLKRKKETLKEEEIWEDWEQDDE